MTGRERVREAMRYRHPDRVPLQYYYTPVGYYEHGEKLNDLFESLPGDFEPFGRKPIPLLPSDNFDEQGKYHVFELDEWGTTWEKRIFGIAGLPKKYPITSPEQLAEYKLSARHDAPIEQLRSEIVEHQKQYYKLSSGGMLLERLHALYPDEDVLCDLVLDEPGLCDLADKIIEYHTNDVQLAIESGADGISFGDDYGTERGMLMSPKSWRSFFKPRLKKLFAPAVAAGLDIVFHSCGKVMDILPDLREVGANAIWPQIPAYNMEELAHVCRNLQLAVAIHTDRANTMTFGTPEQVRALVMREFEVFKMADGGSWFYVEVDNAFPFENIEALVQTIASLRNPS